MSSTVDEFIEERNRCFEDEGDELKMKGSGCNRDRDSALTKMQERHRGDDKCKYPVNESPFLAPQPSLRRRRQGQRLKDTESRKCWRSQVLLLL